MSNVTRRALRVYAALTELRGQDPDVLDALTPFFEPILAVMNCRVFDPHVFSAGVRKLYQWRFTGDIASMFIPKLERKGFLRKKADTSKGVVWIVDYEEQSSDHGSQTIVTAFEQIIDEFEKFPPRVTDLLSYKRTRDELKDILIRFLVLMDTQGETENTPQLSDLSPGGEVRQLLAQLEEGGRELEPNDKYMCARFVRHLMKNRPEFGPHLTRLASIALLTEVVEDFLKPTHVETKTDLTIVLDAPIALDFLGCSGNALKDDIATIINALKAVGASFIVFPASCLEMQRNLRTMLSNSIDQRHGYTHNALIKHEVQLDYVTAVSNAPDRALENAGITVRQMSLDNMPHAHKFFTQEQYEDFFASIYWGNQVPAREHDATCATLVMRLREGKQSTDVFKSRYVMVTRNNTFVRHARSYCLQSRMINEMQEGPIIHQRELATMAWLRTGLGADETIPRGHLIATCDRVLQVRPEVRNALADQLARLTPERLEQFKVLMQDARSMQKLADQTLNNADVVTAENAEHLLEVMREATAEELKEKHEAELEAQKKAADVFHRETRGEIERLSGRVSVLQEQADQAAMLHENQIKAQIASVNRRAWWIELTVGVLLAVVGIAGLYNLATGRLQGMVVWSIVGVLAGIVGFFRISYAILEKPMPALGSLLNVYCRLSLKRRLRLLGLEVEAPRIRYKSGRASLEKVVLLK